MMIIPTLNKGKPKKDNEEKPQIPKTASDLQRLKLEKLMKNPVSCQVLFNFNSLCNIYLLDSLYSSIVVCTSN